MIKLLVSSLVVAAVAFAAQAKLSNDKCPTDKQSPIVFIPGLYSSVLNGHLTGIPENVTLPHPSCKRKTSKMSTYWVDPKNLKLKEFDCMCSTLELEIDPVTGDAHNHPGVEIEAASFGKLHGVERACPLDVTGESDIFGRIIKYLKKQGFQEGTSLFGAPYDWRFFPLPEWIAATRKLIEDAVAKTGRRAIVVAHSLAGPYSYEMLMAQDEAWRKKYVEHWVPLAPVMTGTPIAAFMLVSKSFTNITLVIKYAEPMFMAGKNFQEHYYLAPKKNYGTGRDVFFKSDKRAYTVDDFPELMDRMAIPHGRILFKRAQEFYNKTQLRHPGIQTTAFVSHGYPTISGGVFDKDSDIGFKDPHPVFTDGDGLVTTESLTGVFKKWLADPAYASLTNITDVGKVDHKSILYLDDIKQFISNIACSSL